MSIRKIMNGTWNTNIKFEKYTTHNISNRETMNKDIVILMIHRSKWKKTE